MTLIFHWSCEDDTLAANQSAVCDRNWTHEGLITAVTFSWGRPASCSLWPQGGRRRCGRCTDRLSNIRLSWHSRLKRCLKNTDTITQRPVWERSKESRKTRQRRDFDFFSPSPLSINSTVIPFESNEQNKRKEELLKKKKTLTESDQFEKQTG